MKKVIVALALAMAAISAPAFADSLSAEVRNFTKPDAKELVVQGWTHAGPALLGAELTTNQPDHRGAISNKYVGKVGYALPVYAGFKSKVYGELARTTTTGKSYAFWGAGATAEHRLYGPLSANVGIRHREGFTAANFKEDRYNAGLTYAVTKNDDLGLSYYRVHNSLTGVDRDVIGASVAHKF
jgi:hypothetical protein